MERIDDFVNLEEMVLNSDEKNEEIILINRKLRISETFLYLPFLWFATLQAPLFSDSEENS